MADDVDLANDQVAGRERNLIERARRAAAAIPAGDPGECEDCGEQMPRLVEGRCALCRDGRSRGGFGQRRALA